MMIHVHHVLLAVSLLLLCSMATTSTSHSSRGFGFFQSTSPKTSPQSRHDNNDKRHLNRHQYRKVRTSSNNNHNNNSHNNNNDNTPSRRRRSSSSSTPSPSTTKSSSRRSHRHERDFANALDDDHYDDDNNHELGGESNLYDREGSNSDKDEEIMNEVLSEYDLLASMDEQEQLSPHHHSSQSQQPQQHYQEEQEQEEPSPYCSSTPSSSHNHLQQHNLLQVPCAIRIAPEDTSGLESHSSFNRITAMTAFVDTGAQVTVISKAACIKAGLLHLVDRRYAGHATGVGQVRVLGRIPANTLQLSMGSSSQAPFRSPAITVLEFTGTEGVDLLIGLDFLRDHKATLSLQKDEMLLMVKTSSTATKNNNSGGSGGDTMSIVIPFIKSRKEVVSPPAATTQLSDSPQQQEEKSLLGTSTSSSSVPSTTETKKNHHNRHNSKFVDYFEDDEEDDTDDEDNTSHRVDMSGF